MDINNYIKDCLEKYDKNNELWKDKLKGYTDVDIDKENSIIYFKNNNKIIYKNNYEVIGIYYKSIDLWLWGWATPTQDTTKWSKKLLDYGIHTQLNEYIKTILCNSRIKIKSILELDIFLAIISDIGKMHLYLRKINNIIYIYKL